MIKDTSVGAHMRRTLLAGIVVLVPLVVTVKVLEILFKFTDGLLGNAVGKAFGRQIPGLGLLVFVIGIYLVGLLCRTLAGKMFIRGIDLAIARIPLARTIYSGIKQLIGPFGDTERRTFGKSVMVEYPAKGIYTYGFLVKEHTRDTTGIEMVNVFVSSNHLHLGAVIVVDRKSVIELDMSFEDMIKLMASCGVAAPDLNLNLPLGADSKAAQSQENESVFSRQA